MYWKQANMDSSFIDKDFHGLFKPLVTVTLLEETRRSVYG